MTTYNLDMLARAARVMADATARRFASSSPTSTITSFLGDAETVLRGAIRDGMAGPSREAHADALIDLAWYRENQEEHTIWMTLASGRIPEELTGDNFHHTRRRSLWYSDWHWLITTDADPGNGDGDRRWVEVTVPALTEYFSSTTGDNVEITSLGGDNLATLTGPLLERLPQRARQYASAVFVRTRGTTVLEMEGEPGNQRVSLRPAATEDGSPFTAEQLYEMALTTYRAVLAARIGSRSDEREEAARQARHAHRERSRTAFERHVRRAPDTERHISSLPFVPHGLSSSRRWGIEVESGGARGVQTPDGWNAVSDGSLRSAFDGYVEVQDFEPYDEQVHRVVHPAHCRNSERHEYVIYSPTAEGADPESGYAINPEYLTPDDCEDCGPRVDTVRRTPQTIRHHARNGDCREFVSPILVSMHSNGLEALTTALSQNPQNASAGIHVHVEASDLTSKELATLVFGYDVIEPLIEASYQRERRDYCRRPGVNETLAAARHANDASGADRWSASGRERYLTLNTQSLSRHGTVEFRAMGPVYEYEYLVRWAMLCRELVNSVAAGATTRDFSSITSWSKLLDFLSRFGKEYMRAYVYEQTGDTGNAATLSKAGEPVTTEALDSDLEALLRSFSPQMVRTIYPAHADRVTTQVAESTGDTLTLAAALRNSLVGVAGRPET